MSEVQGSEAVDFDRAHFDGARTSATSCRACNKVLDAEYFSVNGSSTCAACVERLRGQLKGSFVGALWRGLVVGAIGAAVYYAIRAATGYDLALITIVLGIGIGIAVRRGAGGRPSLLYRVLAVSLAWISMCATYVPEMIEGAGQEAPGALLYLVMAVISMFAPYFMLKEGEILGLLIFGFGIWEAWRRSAAPAFVVEGPFSLAQAAPPVEVATPTIAAP